MSDFDQVAAVLVAVISVARTTRLLIYDEFPPLVWLRPRLVALFGDSWGKLFTCQFCLTPYLAAGMGVWAWLSDLNTVWWVLNGWWAASYVAAIVVSRDEPE